MNENDATQSRLMRIFFPPLPTPTRAHTEVFVAKIMARIANEETAELSALWQWLSRRWLMPALSVGLAACFLTIRSQRPESFAPPDALLLATAQTGQTVLWALSSDPIAANESIGMSVEEL